MPSSPLHTYGLQAIQPFENPEQSVTRAYRLKPSSTFAKGTVLGEITASPGVLGAYASGNADGTQNPVGILQIDCATDASGNITYAGATGGGEWGETHLTAPVFVAGTFDTQDLVGLDANAVTKLGRLVIGTTANGVLRIG